MALLTGQLAQKTEEIETVTADNARLRAQVAELAKPRQHSSYLNTKLRPLLQGSNAGEEKNRLRPGSGCGLLCLPLRALQGKNAGEKMNRLCPGRGRGLLCLLRSLQGNNAGEKMLDGKLRARQSLVVWLHVSWSQRQGR